MTEIEVNEELAGEAAEELAALLLRIAEKEIKSSEEEALMEAACEAARVKKRKECLAMLEEVME